MFGYIIGFFIGILIYCTVKYAVQAQRSSRVYRSVVAAIYALNLVEKVNSPDFLLDCDTFTKINEWLVKNKAGVYFEGRGSAFDMFIVINDLKRKGAFKED